MMRKWLFLLCSFGVANAASVSTPILQVEKDRAAVVADNLQPGMSGYIVRKFDDTHSSIIANARVEETNSVNGRTLLRVSQYDGVQQNALPHGNWAPNPSDVAYLANDYDRALLIAPNDDAYYAITKSTPGVAWIHPDRFAAYLSSEGHPTPLVKDFHNYCTANSVGLLYVQSADTLFTLDCKTFALLQTAPSLNAVNKPMLPFWSRVQNIRAAWWGEGSSRLEQFDPYYLEQIALNNPKNRSLYDLYKAKFSDKSALLRYFDIKE